MTLFSAEHFEPAWQKSGFTTNRTWQPIQIKIPVGVEVAVIDGVVGSDYSMATVSYIALDDIVITQEPCSRPSKDGLFHVLFIYHL